jgi:hypothetical protein
LRLVAGLAVVGAAAALGTVALLEGIRPPSRLPSLTSRISDVGEEGLVPPVPARDLSPLGRGAYLLDGPTLVGVGLDSASAEQARRAAGQEGFHWLPRTVGGGSWPRIAAAGWDVKRHRERCGGAYHGNHPA